MKQKSDKFMYTPKTLYEVIMNSVFCASVLYGSSGTWTESRF